MNTTAVVIIFSSMIAGGVGLMILENKKREKLSGLTDLKFDIEEDGTPIPLPTNEPIINIDLALDAAIQAGFEGDSLITILAIAGAESNFNPNAVGDKSLVNEVYQESIGVFQIRALQPEYLEDATGADVYRDKEKLFDPYFNAVAAYEISNEGTNFNAWTTYQNKKYLSFLPQVNELFA